MYQLRLNYPDLYDKISNSYFDYYNYHKNQCEEHYMDSYNSCITAARSEIKSLIGDEFLQELLKN